MTGSTNPPPRGTRWDNERARHDWRAVAEKVQANPRQWVHVASDVSNGTAQNVRKGLVAPLRDLGGKIEAVCRHTRLVGTTRFGDLYVKWTPQRKSSRTAPQEDSNER